MATLSDQYVDKGDLARLRRWKAQESSEAVHFATTLDGWKIAVTQYSSGGAKNHPVLLCHGLGANRWSFDTEPDVSLTQHLVKQGYDVFAADLRGHGRSEKPATSDKKWGWGFNDYCHQDLDAAIDVVLENTGKKQLHYIGHSMGGLLLLARAALQDIRIKSAMTLGSTLDYSDSPSIFHQLIKIKPLGKFLPIIPVHWVSAASSLGAKFTVKAIDPVLVNPSNVNRALYRKMAAIALHPVSGKVMMDLAQAIDGTGLKSIDGSIYADRLKQQGYGFPVLSVAGSADIQCPPVAAARFGTEHIVFGQAFGQQKDYGHDDLIMGKNARTETWPVYVDWLEKHEK